MSRINPTVRGFAIILLIAVGIWLLQLQTALFSLLLLARIAFFLAIAFFVYLLWRERRQEIGAWPTHAKIAFYGGALVIVVALGGYFTQRPSGLDALGFLLVLGLAGFAMFRTWKDQHTYGY